MQITPMRGVEQLTDAGPGHRPAEQIALRFRHGAVDADELKLLGGFDAFDDEFEASVDPALLNWDFEGFDDLPMIHLLSMDD